VVMEGRDIGTVVFPDAEFKFYLDADVMERARRRYAELKEKGTATSLEEVAAQLRERDARDSGRELAPLRAAPDAVVIDSTGLSLERVVNAMKTRIVAGINDRKGLKRT
jgi:cytidylate kinase